MSRGTNPLSVAIVIFALVSNGAYDYVVSDDFKQHNITGTAKWNDKFARAAVA